MAGAAHHTYDGYSSSIDGKTIVDSQSTCNPPYRYTSDDRNVERRRRELSVKIANPLGGYNAQQLGDMGEQYCHEHQLGSDEDMRAFRLGAQVAKDPLRHAEVAGLTSEEKRVFQDEVDHKWRQPRLLYLVIVLCSTCAAVQGMDETVVNGAQIFYSQQFGISGKDPRSTWLLGLVNSAPYLCCALIGCWLTIPFNNLFGRRGTVFITCLFSALTCLWQAFTNNWWHMFIARFFLGFGIGPKSATVPIYAAESSPPAIRGALVMQWQMWTAFGILVGYAADLGFYGVEDRLGITGLNWRLMMGSAMLPAVIVCCFVFMCPESPRWYISKGQHSKAWSSIQKLRFNKVQAARDLFYIQFLIKAEEEAAIAGQNKLREMVSVPRNRRAMIASEIVMFMQQFCGVNIIAYYSSEVFVEANLSELSALGASMGWGVINFLLAIPALYTIDTFGRRNLLLATFPMMSLCLFFTGLSFLIPESNAAHITCIALGLYLFGIFYSPGEGPVPFTYSAEAYPLYIRAQGMSLATATTWFFNFVLAMTWPSLLQSFTPAGAFCWYAGWNIVGFFGVLLFVPETKGKTLEELDQVFGIPTLIHAEWGLRQFFYFFRRYLLLQDVESPKLIEDEMVEYERDSFSQETKPDPTDRV